MPRPRKYATEEELRAARKAQNLAYIARNPERCKELNRARYRRKRDAMLVYQKEWRAKNAELLRAKSRFRKKLHRNKIREQNRQYYRLDLEASRARSRAQYLKLKMDVVEAYGGRCACCGETEPRFLTIEHKNRDGHLHRATLASRGGISVYRDLKRRGWPKDGFCLLCMNCNFSTRFGDPCPHERQAISGLCVMA